MTLDPMMQQLLEFSREAGMPPDFTVIGVAAAKQLAADTASRMGTGPQMAHVEDLKIDGPAGPIRARWYVPANPVDGLIVFYHGGGWVLGTLDGYDPVARRLASASGYALLSIDYRTAPEHPFPAPVEDCYAALRWADRNRQRLCGDSAPLVIAGDSAGGNLAAVVALRARDEGGPRIALQVLIYPVTDCDFSTPSYRAFGDGYLLTAKAMQWFWDQYVADHAARHNPLASPLRANSLAGLPPALVELAGYDCLLDEGAAYARRLDADGVPTATRCWSGLVHGFIQFAMVLPPAGDAADRIGADIKTHSKHRPSKAPAASGQPP
jgi:acetyl esterase